MLKRIIAPLVLACSVIVAYSPGNAGPVRHQMTARLCIPMADMLAIRQSISSGLLSKMTHAAAIIDIHHDVGFDTLQSQPYGLSVDVKMSSPGSPACRLWPASQRFAGETNIAAASVSAFDAAMVYRTTHTWPGTATNVSARNANVVLAHYGRYFIVMLSDNELRTNPNTGKVMLGCDGLEYYWVDVATGRVLPFNGCIEGGGIQALPHLGTLQWDIY